MAGRIYTWIGASGTAFAGNDPAEWSLAGVSPSGPPNQGDSAIVNQGTILLPDAGLHSNTVYLNSGELDFYGDAAITSGFVNNGTNSVGASPTVDSTSVITTDAGLAETVSGAAQSATIGAFGNFVNDGTIDAAGPAGSVLTIAVAGTTINGTFYPGTLTNDGQIDVEAGNTLVIALAGTSELLTGGGINVSGGYLDITGTDGVVSDFGFNSAVVNLGGGGTLETNVPYSGGGNPFVQFTDSTPGNTLKIDNIASFNGPIANFGINDTIDLGSALAVDSFVYDQNTGLLELEQAGSIVATLDLQNTNFASGTFALTGSIGNGSTATADGLGLTLGNDGDTQLVTVPVTYTYIGTPGTAFSGNGSTAGLFSPNGSPQSGDSVIFDNTGTLLLTDATLRSNTLYLGSGTLAFSGDSGTTAGIINNNNNNSGPTLDQNSIITTNVAAAEATPGGPQTATLDLFGKVGIPITNLGSDVLWSRDLNVAID
jgi:hypothetical protein